MYMCFMCYFSYGCDVLRITIKCNEYIIKIVYFTKSNVGKLLKFNHLCNARSISSNSAVKQQP